MNVAQPIVRAAGEGEQVRFAGGGLHTWKATTAETGGAFAILEDEMARGKTTPLHAHPESDEAVYVLEGELLVQIDGDDHVVGPGGFTVVPRGVPHAVLVTSASARILAFMTSGAVEMFFRTASDPIAGAGDLDGPVDFDRVARAAQETGAVEILGPPPFAATAPAS